MSKSYAEFLYGDKYHAIEELDNIMAELKRRRHECQERILPYTRDILRFTEVSPSNIKCVFVGMDPYPTVVKKDGRIVPVATGRSFEVSDFESWTDKTKRASLRNILKSLYYLKTGRIATSEEIRKKINGGAFSLPEPEEWFDAMEENGVVFLNASLTVEENNPGSHQEIWAPFMEKVAAFIVEEAPDAKWILAGKDAQKRFENVIPKENQICCSHPRLASFVTECPFAQVDISWV